MHPVGSAFLLRAASDVAQQSNPSMAVSATIVARKVGWLVGIHSLLSLFMFCPFSTNRTIICLLILLTTSKY